MMLEIASERVADLVPDEAAYAKAYAALPLWRRRKCDAQRFAAGRIRSAAAGVLLGRLCAARGLDFARLEVLEDNFGKPRFETVPDIHFSLSHARDRVMAAVSDRPVGCDVESVRKLTPGLAELCLTAEELARLATLPEGAERQREFCRLWVRKESVVKATGTGFSVDPSSFSVLGPRFPQGLRIRDFDFRDGSFGAVAFT